MEREKAISLLSLDDQKILSEFEEAGFPGLAPQLVADFFTLFLNGTSLREIGRLHPAVKYGAIVSAFVKYSWEERKDQYLNELQNSAAQRMIQVQLESAGFIGDVMTATHKRYGTQIKKYLASGNPADLDGFDIAGIQSYSKLIETFLKVTGQDAKKTLTVKGQLTTGGEGGFKDVLEQAPSPELAAKLLEAFAEDSKK